MLRLSFTAESRVQAGKSYDRRRFLSLARKAVAALSAAPVLGSACTDSGPAVTPASDQTVTAPAVSGIIVQPGTPIISLFTTLANDFFQGLREGGQQAAKSFGLGFEFYVNDLRPEVQLAQHETKVTSGAKMINITPPTEISTKNYALLAKEYECATTIMHETPAWYFPYEDGDHWVYYQIVDGIKAGYEVARRLFEEMGGSGKLLFIQGFPGITSDRLRTTGLMKALKEYPNVELLGSLAGNWNRIDARRAMEDLMTRFPKFDGVYCNNDDMAIGALTAIEEAGKKHVSIVGTDDTAEFMQKIRQGRLLASCAIHPYWSGAFQVARAYDIANGWIPSTPERMMFYGFDVIDRNNIDIYYEKYVTNLKELPFDFERMSRIMHPEDWDPQNLLRPIVPEELWEGLKVPPDGVPASWGEAQEYAKRYQKKIV